MNTHIARERFRTKKGTTNQFLPCPAQANQTEEFAFANIERDPGRPLTNEIPHRDHGFTGFCVCLGKKLIGGATDDHFDQFSRLGVGYRLLADELAIAQHSHTVCNPEDFV